MVSKTTETAYEKITTARENAEQFYDKLRGEGEDNNLLSGVIQKTHTISKNIEDKIKSTVDSLSQVAGLQSEIHKLRERIHYLEKKLKIYEHK